MNYGTTRFKRGTLSKEGDIVIVTASRNHYQALKLKSGEIYNCKYGHFAHNDMIGKEFGSWIIANKIMQRKNNKNNNNKNKIKFGELCLLRPNCELWTLALSHRTQILYDADKSLITYLLQIKPNDIIFESGTGSGSLSTSFSRIISPFGQLFTFEFNKLRAEYARIDFKNLFIDNLITVIHRNIVQNGFPNKKELIQIINNIIINNQNIDIKDDKNNDNKNISEYKDSFGGMTQIDKYSWLTDDKLKNLKQWISNLTQINKNEFVNGVFLDLPKPWDAIKSAYNVLKFNGKICSFSPCIEQVQKTCQVLGINGFVDIRTFEVLSRDHLVRKHQFPQIDLNTNNSIHEIRSRPNQDSDHCDNDNNNNNKPCINTISSRPIGKSFGHTGYLTFAIKSIV